MKFAKNKLLIFVSMILFVLVSLPMGLIEGRNVNAFEIENNKPVFSGSESILMGSDFNFADAGQNADTYTSFDFENRQRFSGNSWSPQAKIYESGNELLEHQYIEDEVIQFDETITLSLTGKSLYFWIYFDSDIAKQHEFYLIKNGDSYLKWIIDTDTMITLFKKTNASSYDIAVYTGGEDISGNGIPYGWNLVELPISEATNEGDVDLNSDDFVGFGINQSTEQPLENLVLIYNLLLDNNSGTTKVKNHISQDNVLFLVNTKTIANKKYFAGEVFKDIPTFNYLFGVGDVGSQGYLWIGKKDFSAYSELSEYSKYFSVIISNSNGSKTYTLGGGGVSSLESGNYTITYCVYPNADSEVENISLVDEIVLYYDEFVVGSYGQGVWFIENKLSATIGETYVIRYKIHEAFNGFTNDVNVSFENEGILELVEHNKVDRTITFKVIAEGSTAIKLTLTSGRLSPEYIDVELLENSTFLVSTSQPSVDDNNTTRILLWIVLGVLLAFGLGYLIKTIIDSRKIEVK